MRGLCCNGAWLVSGFIIQQAVFFSDDVLTETKVHMTGSHLPQRLPYNYIKPPHPVICSITPPSHFTSPPPFLFFNTLFPTVQLLFHLTFIFLPLSLTPCCHVLLLHLRVCFITGLTPPSGSSISLYSVLFQPLTHCCFSLAFFLPSPFSLWGA